MWEPVLFVNMLLVIVTLAIACSPPIGVYNEPTLDWKTMNSEVVAYGVVLSSKPDLQFDENVYNVEFEIRCFYKGAPSGEIIRIDHVGSVPGHCISTNLTVGMSYVVYLHEGSEPGRYLQSFVQDPGEEDYLVEIVTLCETTVSYPKGRNKTHNQEVCMEKGANSECVPQPAITEPFYPIPYGEDEVATDSRHDSVDGQPASPHGVVTNLPDGGSQEEAVVGENSSTLLVCHMSLLLINLVLSVLRL